MREDNQWRINSRPYTGDDDDDDRRCNAYWPFLLSAATTTLAALSTARPKTNFCAKKPQRYGTINC